MKKRIVIASTLKPVDDVRVYWKFSQSITKTNKYEVNIIGNGTKKEPKLPYVHFKPHHLKKGQWLKRWLLPLGVWYKILLMRPKILIISTHELIFCALACKAFLSCKIIYDVQENYALNLTGINPNFIKRIYAMWVRFKEVISRPFIDTYWLAEQCYQAQLTLTKGKSIVVENKAYFIPIAEETSPSFDLLFTGTISEYAGIRRAINFFLDLLEICPESRLKIIGQYHDQRIKKYLEKNASQHDSIHLNISPSPIPHEEILAAIKESRLGIISYKPSSVNSQKIPTKLYEYSRYNLPYLVEQESYWSEIGIELGGAIPVDFDNPSINIVLQKLEELEQSKPWTYPESATWESESIKVIESINQLIQ